MTIQIGGGGGGGGGLSNATPLANGIAASGTALLASRDDHVHPSAGGGALLPTGKYVQLMGSVNAGFTPAVNREYIVGFLLAAQVIDRLAMKVNNTPDAGTQVRIGIRAGTTGLQGAIAATQTVALTGGAGWKTGVYSYSHPGGVLFISYVFQGWTTTAPSMDGGQVSSSNVGANVLLVPTAAGVDNLVDMAAGNQPWIGYQDGITSSTPDSFVQVVPAGTLVGCTIAARRG